MAETNVESYFASDLPGVFINRIVLDTAGGSPPETPFNKDPHIVQPVPDVELVESSSPEILKIKVDFNLKVKTQANRASKDLFSSWMFSKYFLNYYKIALILLNDSEAYQMIQTTLLPAASTPIIKQMIQAFAQPANPGGQSKVLSLGGDNGIFNLTSEEDINSYLQSLEKVAAGNNHVYSVPFSYEAELSEPYPEHLSLLVIPYIDFNQIKIDYDLEDSDIDADHIFGQIISELIIHNGETSALKRVFYERPTIEEFNNFIPTLEIPAPRGKIYAGPAHQMPGGGWMKGASHGQMDDAPLTIRQINNNVVQDMRIAKQLEKISFDYSLIENNKLGFNSPKLSTLINDNLDVVRNPSYISSLSTSRDHTGNCRFFFSVDYLTMIKKNSVFKILFDRSTDNQIANLLKGSIIRQFKFFRKRVKGKSGSAHGPGLINKLGMAIGSPDFDSNKAVDFLIRTGDNIAAHSPGTPGTRLLSQTSKRNRNTFTEEQAPVGQFRIASLGEVNLLTPIGESRSNYPYMRHFSGVDFEVSMLTDGFYQYGVEIEIEDPTVNYMENKLSELADLIALYEEYYAIASGLNTSQGALSTFGEETIRVQKTHNFSLIAQRYIPEFLVQLEKYESGHDFYTIAAEARLEDSGVLITSHVNQYFDTLQLLTKGELRDDDTDNFIKGLAKVLSPINGTPAGISTFIKLLNSLAGNMKTLLDSAISGPVNKSPANSDSPEKPLSRFKVDATRIFKISKHFSDVEEIFDADVPKSFGVDYVTSYMLPESLARGDDMGLISINTADYLERAVAETNKFFGPGNVWNLPDVPTNQMDTTLANSPNQLKALYGLVTYLLDPDLISNVDMLVDWDKLRTLWNTGDVFGFIYTNIINLAKVEILSGYEVDNSAGQNEAQMKKPRFNLLDDTRWGAIGDLDAPSRSSPGILCRLRPSGNQTKALDMPIYNEHFFMHPATSQSGISMSDGGVNLTTPYQAAKDQPLASTGPDGEIVLAVSPWYHPVPISRFKYSHLAPSRIHVPSAAKFDVLRDGFNKTDTFYDSDKYSEILLNILRYNNGLGVSLAPYNIPADDEEDDLILAGNLSIDKQKVRAQLIDFMASKSCTVNNMISFTAETENNVITDLCGNLDSLKGVVDAEEGYDMTDFLNAGISKKSNYGLDAMSWDSIDPTHILSKLAKRFMTDFNFGILKLKTYNLFGPDHEYIDQVPQPTTTQAVEEGATAEGTIEQITAGEEEIDVAAGTTGATGGTGAGATESPAGGDTGVTGPSGPEYL